MKKNKKNKYDICQLCDEELENSGSEVFNYCNICNEHKNVKEKLKNSIDISAIN